MNRVTFWMRERTRLILAFVALFFFGDAVTTAIGVEVGLAEGNPLMSGMIESSWEKYFIFKAVSTLFILMCFFLLYTQGVKRAALETGGGTVPVRSIDLQKNNTEFFTWGVFMTISALIVLSNVVVIVGSGAA